MSHTPPRLRATLGPQPLARLSLTRRAVERPRAPPSMTPALAALAFGRAIDASHRSDADFFIAHEGESDDPVRGVVLALREAISPAREVLGDLLRLLDSFDPADVSAALDRVIATLVVEEAGAEEVLRALQLGEALRTSIVQDDGLTELAAAKILTYGALEAYYYRRATPEAKVALDAYRDLIQLATGHRLDYINPDDTTELGMKVWEGWQAIRGLNLVFGLSNLAIELKRQKVQPLPALLFGADVILYAGFDAADPDAVEESIAQLELLAMRANRRADLERAEHARTLILERLPDQPPDTIPDDLGTVTHTGTLNAAVRGALASDAKVTTKPRSTVAIVEDLASALERYEILMDGDDGSLVFALAPAHQRCVKDLYAELAAHHAKVEAAVFDEESAPSRDVVALRMLLNRAHDLDLRYEELRRDLGTGDLEVGYETD